MAAHEANKVDAALYARAGTAVERSYVASDLPRVVEAGAGPDSAIKIGLQFSEYENRPAVTGELSGTVVLTCQRCLKDVRIPLQAQFRVVLVGAESELAGEPGGYEPILVDAGRLDLRWLAEEETLLALPLVALHDDEQCRRAGPPSPDDGAQAADEEQTTQRPFADLRERLRKR